MLVILTISLPAMGRKDPPAEGLALKVVNAALDRATRSVELNLARPFKAGISRATFPASR